MKIHFTKKEFRTLIKLMQISDWIMYAHKTQSEITKSAEIQLIQKIYSYSKEMGCEDLIEYSKGLNIFVETHEAEFNSEANTVITEYNEENFWEELIDRLSNRDILHKYTKEEFSRLSDEEKINTDFDSETPWVEEFKKYGIKRIGIVKK
ncbi:hypothetical protein JWG39_04095 [Desulforhopalus vacuolatus]|uniref:hypothetical protein n=1 Tax=Desulforhopalus vacuolatus TaxID=40414 RepID=UPI001965D24D|nr:hypothetical protein [Desulforhopalus vacuolatus]MBM9518996.1 hypothetical protein [Desulforhopalus vacuolatus]